MAVSHAIKWHQSYQFVEGSIEDDLDKLPEVPCVKNRAQIVALHASLAGNDEWKDPDQETVAGTLVQPESTKIGISWLKE